MIITCISIGVSYHYYFIGTNFVSIPYKCTITGGKNINDRCYDFFLHQFTSDFYIENFGLSESMTFKNFLGVDTSVIDDFENDLIA